MSAVAPIAPDDTYQVPEFLATVMEALDDFLEDGESCERKEFERKVGINIGLYQRRSNIWQFIADAVDGCNGFADGFYIYPHLMEIENSKESDKLRLRRAQSDYYNFARRIATGAWDCIVGSKDLIQRKTDDSRLADFWQNVDGRGTSIIDFLEYPQRQLRMYGTAFVFVDRPFVDLVNRAVDQNPDYAPYMFCVPTQNVVDWTFDELGVLQSIIFKCPEDEYKQGDACAIRVWTRDAWADFSPTDSKGTNYNFVQGGPNPLGEVPCVMIFNDDPGPGKGLGQTEMPDVARLAQTVFNIDSEAREIQRKCSLFLAMPVKDSKEFEGKKLEYGTENVMLYDGEAGEPRWISPDLGVLTELAKTRTSKIDDAFEMAQLRGLVAGDVVQTKSGFHAEVEFSKTEKRIARHGASLENAEQKIARLVLRHLGVTDARMKDQFSIVYPREYNVRDVESVMARAERIIAMNLGDDANREELTSMFKALYPRKADDEITKLVESGVSSLKANRQATAQIDTMASQRVSSQRIRDLLDGKVGGQ